MGGRRTEEEPFLLQGPFSAFSSSVPPLGRTRLQLVLLFILTAHAFGVRAEDDTLGDEINLFACNGTSLNLSCPGGQVISVKRANYGRFSIALCNQDAVQEWSVNCFTPGAKHKLTERCDGLHACSLSPSDFSSSDPCPGTDKYLEAHYVCLEPSAGRRVHTSTAKPIPPWLRLGNGHQEEDERKSINSRRRPPPMTAAPATEATATTAPTRNRVPITAPPKLTTTTTTTTTTTPRGVVFINDALNNVVSAAPVYKQKERQENGHNHYSVCGPTRARGLTWPPTSSGLIAQQPCPNNPDLTAMWECGEGGRWVADHPNLSECRSAWMVRLMREEELLLKSPPSRGWTSLSRAAEGLDQQLGMYPAFGGDILAAVEVVKAVAKRMNRMVSSPLARTTSYTSSSSFDHQPPNPSVLAMEVAGKLTRALSTLLSPRAAPAWDDLSREGSAARAAEGVAAAEEELAAALPVAAGWVGTGNSNQASRPPDVAVVTTDNIHLSVRLLPLDPEQRRNAVLTLPGSLNARDPRLHLQPHHEDYVSNSVNSYSGDDEDDEVGKVELPVRMVSLSAEASHAVLVTMKGIQLQMDKSKSKSKGFNVASVSFASNTGQLIKEKVTDRHTNSDSVLVLLRRPKWQLGDTFARCLSWSSQLNSWRGDSCMTVESNDTHTSCSCSSSDGLTRYTLASSDEKPPILKSNIINNDVVTKSSSDSETDLHGLSAGWTFVLAVVASSISLVVVVAAAALIIVYCKRVKIRDSKSENVGNHHLTLPCDDTSVGAATTSTTWYSDLSNATPSSSSYGLSMANKRLIMQQHNDSQSNSPVGRRIADRGGMVGQDSMTGTLLGRRPPSHCYDTTFRSGQLVRDPYEYVRDQQGSGGSLNKLKKFLTRKTCGRRQRLVGEPGDHVGLRSTLSHRYLQQQRQHPYMDYRTWANRQSRDLEVEASSPSGYQAGIFHLPANAGVSAHNPLSHYNPLLHEQVFGDGSPVLAGAAIRRQQQQQQQVYQRPLSASSGNQHIYMEVDAKYGYYDSGYNEESSDLTSSTNNSSTIKQQQQQQKEQHRSRRQGRNGRSRMVSKEGGDGDEDPENVQ